VDQFETQKEKRAITAPLRQAGFSAQQCGRCFANLRPHWQGNFIHLIPATAQSRGTLAASLYKIKWRLIIES
jgi:hypothetical protein